MTRDTYNKIGSKDGRREAYKEFSSLYIPVDQSNVQNVFTPFHLCFELMLKLDEYVCMSEHKDWKILCLNLEFVEILLYEFDINRENVWFITDCKRKAEFASLPMYAGIHVVFTEDVLTAMGRLSMKFDIVVGNPPYQAPKEKEHEGRGMCGKSLWDKFVTKSFDLVEQDGYICFIHPSRWHAPYDELGKEMRKRQILYLEIHSAKEGKATFGCFTRYDWYIMKNSMNVDKTVVKDQQGIVGEYDLSDVPFIPNSRFKEVMSLIARKDAPTVELLHNSSYHTQNKTRNGTMSKEKEGAFVHPCIYSISKENEPRFWYSSIPNKHHPGVPKAIFVSGSSTGVIEDIEGKYALTQFASGIIDTAENVKRIVTAMRSSRFLEVANAISVATSGIDRNIIACFRKDFWQEFVNEDGSEKV